MTAKNRPNDKLAKRLREAEEILDALRNHKVDAVVGTDQITLLRLKEVEDQLQEQIRISANRLEEIETIYQNVPVGLCTLDLNLKCIRINTYLAKMIGIPAGECSGRTVSKFFPEMVEDIEKNLQQVIDTGEPQMHVELSGEQPGQPGVKRYWLVHLLPLYDQQGVIIGINMVLEDITERKRSEKKLQQLNMTLEDQITDRTKVAEDRADQLRKMALQMTQVEEKERQRLARVLHDGLQQLLIGAKLNARMIRNHIPDSEVNKEFDQLDQILDQAIDDSRSLSYELSPPILHDHGLSAALHWFTGMPHMQGLSVKIHTDADLPELSQNLKVFLFQAVRELLINIIKHADVNTAAVRLNSDEQNFTVEVIDNGKGFDVTKGVSDAPNNLGLRGVQEKLDLMGGQLVIDSQPGKGSHFILQVPIETFELSAPATSSLETARKSSEKNGESEGYSKKMPTDTIEVLVVDDHQVMRNGLVRLLNEEPDIKIVGEASDGLEAIDFVNDQQPDVIIMDISMPRMNGIKATSLIHQKFPEVLIIGLSMHEEDEYAALMKEAGAKTLLNKAGPAEQLLKVVRHN